MLEAICLGFGSVSRVDILISSQVGKRQALCFLRMATKEQEETLMRELGVGRFGGDIVVIVDLSSAERRVESSTFGHQLVNPQTDPRRFKSFFPLVPSANVLADLRESQLSGELQSASDR